MPVAIMAMLIIFITVLDTGGTARWTRALLDLSVPAEMHEPLRIDERRRDD
jgi:hypothetical protein